MPTRRNTQRTSDIRASQACAPHVGHLLRRWRTCRAMSQERLAVAANTTCRYISFIENGRATPSRAMLERLAAGLCLDGIDCNLLFEAAGYLPNCSNDCMATIEIAATDSIIDLILQRHMPEPAFAVGPDWTLLRLNPAADALFRLGRHPGQDQPLEGQNVLDILIHPEGLQPWIVNWHEHTWRTIQYLQRAWWRMETPPAIMDRILSNPEAARLAHQMDPPAGADQPGKIVFSKGGQTWSYFQLRGRLAMPEHAVGRDVYIELLCPSEEGGATPHRPSEESA